MRPRTLDTRRSFRITLTALTTVITALVVLASSLACATALADDTATRAPHILGPDAQRFFAPLPFAYWAGTERTMDGELSLAMPRPFEGGSLAPARDEHRSTTTYVRFAHSELRRNDAWNAIELTSLHDLRGGAVLGASFRGDAREHTAVQGIATLTLPVTERIILVPTIEAGARSDVVPELAGGFEMRIDRRSSRGYTLGTEVSRWTNERTRTLWKIGSVHRLSRTVAIEERVAIGVWAGQHVIGDFAMQWIGAALQSLGTHVALYERVTFARGAALPIAPAPVDHSALSLDLSVGARWSAGAYGVVLQLDEGAQEGRYARWGVDLTLYSVLF